jgi:hypothetical protein
MGKAEAGAAGPCQPAGWKRGRRGSFEQTLTSIIHPGQKSDTIPISTVNANDELGGFYPASGGQGDAVRVIGNPVPSTGKPVYTTWCPCLLAKPA